jgi:hypothetical protein
VDIKIDKVILGLVLQKSNLPLTCVCVGGGGGGFFSFTEN